MIPTPTAFAVVVAVACDIHAERHLAKAGGSNCKLRGIPTLATEQGGVERAERMRRSAQAQRGRLGKRLAGARGGAPLRGLAVAFRVGVAGRNGPLRWVADDGRSRQEAGRRLPPFETHRKKMSFS